MERLKTIVRYLFQGTFVIPPNLPGPVQQLFGATTLADLFNAAFKTAIVVGAMLAVIRLIYAGFMYMTSDVWGNKQKATEIIQEATLGLLLLLAVYLILNQINPDLLNLNILRSVTPIPSSSTLPPGVDAASAF